MGDSPLGAWLREQGAAATGSGPAAAADGQPKGWSADAEPELPGPLAGPWDADGGRPRRRRLRLLAGGAWAVVLVLGAVAVVGGAGSSGAPVGAAGPSEAGGEAVPATTVPSASLPVEPDGVAAAGASVPGAAHGASAPAGIESADAAPAPDAATVVGPDDAPASVAATADAAVAAMAVREAFSDAAAPRFVDEAVAVGVTGIGSPDGGLRVVTVAALVLEGGEGGWHGARQARYAVVLGGPPTNPQPVGDPWPLADPIRPAPGRGAPVAEPARIEAVASALVAAGYAEVEVPALTLSAADPALLVADIVAVSPGGGARAPRTVLLADGPAPVLLGADR